MRVKMRNSLIRGPKEAFDTKQGEGGMTVFTVKMPLKRSLSSQKGMDHVKK